MKIYLQLSLVCLASLVSACQSTTSDSTAAAAANPQAEAKKPMLRSMGHGASAADRKIFISEHDTNSDEQVSRAEIEIFRKARFDEADINRDGTVSENEYVDEYAARLDRQIDSARQAHVEQTHTRFKSLDKNNDGVISRDEYQASGDRTFAQWDKHNTGKVAIDASAKKHAQKHTKTREQRSVLAMPTSHSPEGFLELYDDNADSQVTRAEFDQQRLQAFVATDANANGKLDADEYLLEFENRVDRQAESVRAQQIKQAHVRFGVIDTDKSARIEWQEFLAIGTRGFERWDANSDGVVSAADPLPAPRADRPQNVTAKKPSTAAY